jgi:TonB family protein
MFCLNDGTALLPATAAAGDPNATLRMPAPRSTDPGPTVDSAKAPTLVAQPLKAGVEPAPFVSPGFGPAEGARKSPLPWILGIVIVLSLAGLGIAFIISRALQQQNQQSAHSGSPTASPSAADITSPVSPSSTPGESSNLSGPATSSRSPPRSNAADTGATPKPKPTTTTKSPPEPTPEVDRKPTPPRAPISGGVLNGKAISLPKPPYPAIARAAHASGTVIVQVLIDEAGNVISAHAVSGHPLLQAASVAAARQAKFAPTKLSGQPVKVNGVIQYNFVAQ